MARVSELRNLVIGSERFIEEKITEYFNKDGIKYRMRVFICKCPTENCENTVTIRNKRHLKNKCLICSNKGKVQPKKIDHEKYDFFTDNLEYAKLSISKKFPTHFVREMKGSKTGRSLAVMKCSEAECNNETHLRTYDTKLKKCLVCSHRKLRPYEEMFNRGSRRYYQKKNGSIIKWELTYEEFASLCEMPNCTYCGESLNRTKYKTTGKTLCPLLDRKDPNKGYTLQNCVPCCPTCNYLKNQLSFAEMMIVMNIRRMNKEFNMLTGTENLLAQKMFTMVQAEIGALPNAESVKQLQKLCNGLAKAIVPHIVSMAQVAPGIPTAGSPVAQATTAPGTII